MATVRKTPKKQEIEQREALLIETAGQILLSEGVDALSMERLAAELNTAKGTIYNHYPNREELLLAMSVRAVNKRQTMFDIASMSRGSARDRILAVAVACEIYVLYYPLHFTVESIVRHGSIWDCCSEKRRQLLHQREGQCVALVSGIIRSAIANGELALPPNMRPDELTLSLWALVYGAHIIDKTSPSLGELGIASTWQIVRLSTLHLLNGFNWQPLWTAAEQEQRIASICESVFPNERALPTSIEQTHADQACAGKVEV